MKQTYFLTGALGCIGAWVVKTVLEQGDTPVVFDLGGDTRRLRDVLSPAQLESVVFVQGDVSEYAQVRSAIGESGATRIIHLAGLQVPFCRNDPAAGARVNVLGTIHMFEAAKAAGIERVVYASSAAVYGPPDDAGAPDESSRCDPTTMGCSSVRTKETPMCTTKTTGCHRSAFAHSPSMEWAGIRG